MQHWCQSCNVRGSRVGGGSWSQSVNCHVAVNGVAQEQGVKCTGNYTVQWGSVTGVATGTYPCMAWSFGRGGVAIIAKLFQDLPRHKGHHVSHAVVAMPRATVTAGLAEAARTVRRLLVEGTGTWPPPPLPDSRGQSDAGTCDEP